MPWMNRFYPLTQVYIFTVFSAEGIINKFHVLYVMPMLCMVHCVFRSEESYQIQISWIIYFVRWRMPRKALSWEPFVNNTVVPCIHYIRWLGAYRSCCRLSPQSTVHSRYLTMYSLQRTQRGHPTARPKGRGVVCPFWVLSLSLSELSVSSFSCCFQCHLIFDCVISIVYSNHVLVFLYLGGQPDKLCFSVRPPSRNEPHTDCKLYHVFLLGK